MKCPPLCPLVVNRGPNPTETDQLGVLRRKNLISEDFIATGEENLGSKCFRLSLDVVSTSHTN